MKNCIPTCPEEWPELKIHLSQLSNALAVSKTRPRISGETCHVWQTLLRKWVDDVELPLFIRKHRDNRGTRLKHRDGRTIIPADNGPAHWVISLALKDFCPTLDEVRKEIQDGKIPVAMIVKRSERATFTFQSGLQKSVDVNKAGWKVCHIDKVALGSSKPLAEVPMEKLKSHFLRFLSPTNMFVVPLKYSWIGELPELVEAVRKADFGNPN